MFNAQAKFLLSPDPAAGLIHGALLGLLKSQFPITTHQISSHYSRTVTRTYRLGQAESQYTYTLAHALHTNIPWPSGVGSKNASARAFTPPLPSVSGAIPIR